MVLVLFKGGNRFLRCPTWWRHGDFSTLTAKGIPQQLAKMELLMLISWISHGLTNGGRFGGDTSPLTTSVQKDADEALSSHRHQMFLNASQRNGSKG